MYAKGTFENSSASAIAAMLRTACLDTILIQPFVFPRRVIGISIPFMAGGVSANVIVKIMPTAAAERFVFCIAPLDSPVCRTLVERLAAQAAHPPAHTHVIGVFTGAAHTGDGLIAYLDQYAPPVDLATFALMDETQGAERAALIKRGYQVRPPGEDALSRIT